MMVAGNMRFMRFPVMMSRRFVVLGRVFVMLML